MSDSESKSDVLPQRLCSEIQLFDLCDLSSCNHRNGRFCTDSDLLGRFEKIAEAELRAPERFSSDDGDEEYDDDDAYDDEFSMDNSEGGEDDVWEEE